MKKLIHKYYPIFLWLFFSPTLFPISYLVIKDEGKDVFWFLYALYWIGGIVAQIKYNKSL